MTRRRRGRNREGGERPRTLDDITFFASQARILWRMKVLKYQNGSMAASLQRVGQQVATIQFGWNELSDLLSRLKKLKEEIKEVKRSDGNS